MEATQDYSSTATVRFGSITFFSLAGEVIKPGWAADGLVESSYISLAPKGDSGDAL